MRTIEDWQVQDAQRLDALFKERARLNQAEFGERYQIGTQGMVWQYLSGRRALNIKSAEAFARGMGVRIEEFSPTIAKQIAQAAEMIGESTGAEWPLPAIDEQKVKNLTPTQRAQLEAALLIAAGQVGLDIKKNAK